MVFLSCCIRKWRIAASWRAFPLLGFLLITAGVGAQRVEREVDVLDFSDGLSHRNVFSIRQDAEGFLWIATFNGLNRFDGYRFEQYRQRPPFSERETDFTNGIAFDEQGRMWVGSPDFLTVMEADGEAMQSIKIKEGPIERRSSLVPTNMQPYGQFVWLTTQEERSGAIALQLLTPSGALQEVLLLPGQYAQRPLLLFDSVLYLGYYEHLLYRLDPQTGLLLGRDSLPTVEDQTTRVVDLQSANGKLWVLMSDGRLFFRGAGDNDFEELPLELSLEATQELQTLYVSEEEDIWIGGLGLLWQYDQLEKRLIDHDALVRQVVRNTCNYRQIYRDLSGTIWVASDFGAIRIAQSDRLFDHYLAGGSEYCSNVQCSVRGITEDDAGNIYISYYNSIHVLDPAQNSVRPLFPSNDYFNYPFGIAYDAGKLYTGNGLSIDLETLRTDTLFRHPPKDLGAVTKGPDGDLWFGYQHYLYRYDPERRQLRVHDSAAGPWQPDMGAISYLYFQDRTLWVGTLDNGLYREDLDTGTRIHYHRKKGSPAKLAHPQINAILGDGAGKLYVATGNGLQILDTATNAIRTLGEAHQLPNLFINGILSEGDSCLWLSTDYGLCRYSLATDQCLNFFTADGLSSNEFNRISFFQARDGRLYFGGLNGVNAFYPSERYLAHKAERRTMPLLLTGFSYLDGRTDSLHQLLIPADEDAFEVELSHLARVFMVEFTLADYRSGNQNLYSYLLKGYDQAWSEEQMEPLVRFNDIPPGNYTLRVRGRSVGQPWSPDELAIPIHIRQPYYQSFWFWLGIAGVGLLLLLALFRYRIYLAERRQQALELEVARRTRELEAEKQKSEELLLNILPAETAEELKLKGFARAQRYNHITVLFSDFKNFTRISEQLQPEELVAEIDYHFCAFDDIIDRHGLEKIKTIGDAYLCIGGLDGDGPSGALRAVAAALDIQAFMDRSARERIERGQPVFEARIGLHTGPVIAGVVGTRKFAYDIWGETVNIASRMETVSPVGRVNISGHTYQLVAEQFEAEPYGNFEEHRTRLSMYLVIPSKGAAFAAQRKP